MSVFTWEYIQKIGPLTIFVLIAPVLYILFTIYFYFTNTSRFSTHTIPLIIIFVCVISLICIEVFFKNKDQAPSEMGPTGMLMALVLSPIIFLPPFYVFDDIKYLLFRNKSNNNIRRNTVSNT